MTRPEYRADRIRFDVMDDRYVTIGPLVCEAIRLPGAARRERAA